MQKVTPMEPGSQGEKVGSLHKALRLLLDRNILEMDQRERETLERHFLGELEEQVYGEVTIRLVQVFQEQHHLDAEGIVDAATAEAINALLEELGAFDKPTSGRLHIVAGQVRRENGKPYFRSLIRALHKDDHGLLRLGEDETDSDGFYTIRYDASPIEGAVNLFVAALGADGRPVGESDITENAGTRETLNITVPAVDTQTYQIEGKVHSRFSAATGGLRVVVVDKRVGGDVELATTQTNESGAYQASFKDRNLRRSGKDLPDLQVRVFREDKFLGASDVRYNALNRETLNVLLDEKSTEALQSEIETLTGSLAKHVQGNLRDLKDK